MQIKSSTTLRKEYGAISELARETGEPIYITVNGEGDTVIMNLEAFEQREEEIRLRAKLELAEQSRLAGEPTFSIEESRARLNALFEARHA